MASSTLVSKKTRAKQEYVLSDQKRPLSAAERALERPAKVRVLKAMFTEQRRIVAKRGAKQRTTKLQRIIRGLAEAPQDRRARENNREARLAEGRAILAKQAEAMLKAMDARAHEQAEAMMLRHLDVSP